MNPVFNGLMRALNEGVDTVLFDQTWKVQGYDKVISDFGVDHQFHLVKESFNPLIDRVDMILHIHQQEV